MYFEKKDSEAVLISCENNRFKVGTLPFKVHL